jgi:peroxiredoxin
VLLFYAGLALIAPARPAMLEPVLAARGFLPPGSPVLPRYRFEVGQEVVYRTRGEIQSDSVTGMLDRTTRFLVTNESPDGVWRLVISVVETERRADSPADRPPRTTVCYVDLSPDGRYASNPTLKPVDRAAFLIPLPADAGEAAAGWVKPDPSGFAAMEFTIAGFDPRDDYLLAMRQTETGLRSRAYGSRYAATTLFDTALGLPVYREVVSQEGYHVAGSWVLATTLDTARYLEEAELDSFVTEADVWFSAHAEWDSLTDLAETDEARADAFGDEADSVLARARARLTRPEFIASADQRIASYRRAREHRTAAGRGEQGRVGIPAPEWRLDDIEGRVHRLADYRGSVVVLDFWYRLCGWCIRALPHLQLLRERYRDRPVQILGVNVDEDPADAKFIAAEFKLNYPTLLAESTQQDYGVTSYPTLYIIDRDGVIAHVQRGYSERLDEELAAVIDQLLGE